MVSVSTLSDGAVRIQAPDRFDFRANSDFRAAYESIEIGCPRVEVDFSRTEFMDSAALGMLLLLREHRRGSGKAVALANCNPTVRQILDIANFGTMFDIDD